MGVAFSAKAFLTTEVIAGVESVNLRLGEARPCMRTYTLRDLSSLVSTGSFSLSVKSSVGSGAILSGSLHLGSACEPLESVVWGRGTPGFRLFCSLDSTYQ